MAVKILKLEPKKSGGYDLSPLQMKALPLVVSGVSNKDVASAINCNVRTVSVWQNHDEKFQQAVKAETDRILDSARQKIVAASTRAVEKLVSTLAQAPSANVTRAAQLLLDRAGIVSPSDSLLAANGISPEVAALANLIHQRRAAELLDKEKANGQ